MQSSVRPSPHAPPDQRDLSWGMKPNMQASYAPAWGMHHAVPPINYPFAPAAHYAALPYKAEVWRGGKHAYLGSFATAEEAALCVARSPEG